MPQGTPYRLSFDYKADKNADADFQCANEPGEYILWYIGENDTEDFSFTTSWQTFSKDFIVPGDCDGSKSTQGDWLNNFQTIYFSLAMKAKDPDAEDNVFIIDNVKVEIPTEVLKTLTPKPVTDPSLMLTYVTKDAANQWSFTMPGYDMELTPEYAPVAQWAIESDKELIPTAAEGAIAGTDAPIIVEGTVATGQGTAMYFATTNKELTAEQAAQANGWLSTLPTAAGYDDATTVYVWYYIQGADTPDGEEATALNTFNDSEICAQPLEVSVLTNKFDITFNAANANTIEAGKATVTVGGTAATVTEGKLEAIKMGSEVKLEAKQGYKFRKVEVKKKAAEALTALNITNPVVGQVIGSDGKNYAYGTLPTGVTAVAKICYVSGSNGLALALADEGQMNWSTAIETCAAHTPAFTGGTWKLATQDEWNSMISAAGSDTDLRYGFSSVGRTNMREDRYYWSSTEWGSVDAGIFCDGEWDFANKNEAYYVRACLAF